MEYIVSWREGVDGTNEFITTTVSGSARSHVIDDLEATTIYQIAVAAVNSRGVIGSLSEVSGMTLSPPPRALMLEGVTTNSIAVNWQPPSSVAADITEYIIYWNVVGRGISRFTTVPVTQTSYVITELDAQTRYQIEVATVSRDGLVGERTELLLIRTLGLATMAQTISVGFHS